MSESPTTFPCSRCGATLEFEAGTEHLQCPYCGSETHIAASEKPTLELDFDAFLVQAEAQEEVQEQLTVDCQSCGARTCLGADITAGECNFCGTKLVAQSKSTKAIQPRSLLPFRITQKNATEAFRQWLAKLWFAPNAIKKYARLHGIQGVYCPFWTYDCKARTQYTGQRGEHYYTESTSRKSAADKRRVRKTRWQRVSGTVRNSFDDILIRASTSLPDKHAAELEPWDLKSLTAYDERYLSGFTVQSYTVGLREGFQAAQQAMEPKIAAAVHSDIGGDAQRVESVDSSYGEITFKHVLLPVWICGYRYQDVVYRFLINARTGEVQGERPWSTIKIVLAALFALLVAFLGYRL
jgi:DNA-directed RNA polymerase subunit RPC12/RpoP